MTSVAIIPARGNSVRIPRKNIKLFHGRPIIEYSIETAKQSGLFGTYHHSIFVSTDDEEVAEISKKAGAMVWMRSHCDGSMGTQEVAAIILRELWLTVDIACVLYATAPLLYASDLQDGFAALKNDRQFSMSVGGSPLCDAGAYYFGRKKAFCDSLPLIAPHTAMVPLPAERVCDINTLEDFERAEQFYTALRMEKP